MKRDIITKRNDLIKKSIRLRELKFDERIKNDDVSKLIEEQNKIYNMYKFYDGYIKANNNNKRLK